MRTIGDLRYYYELFSDIVLVLRGQAGHIMGFGHQEATDPFGNVVQLPGLRMLDHFPWARTWCAGSPRRASGRAT